jgi:hypothetical protein
MADVAGQFSFNFVAVSIGLFSFALCAIETVARRND